MTKVISIDKAGRVVIPRTLRKALHLNPGDNLQLESSGEEITLRPVHETTPLQKENGIWVYRTGLPLKDLSITDWIDKVREGRSQNIVRPDENIL